MSGDLHAALEIALGPMRLEVELDAPAGRTLAVIGSNGAGKSTILSCLAGILAPDVGRISLGGTTLLDTAGGISLPAAERRVGVVFQDPRLFPHLTVLDNVAFGPRSRGASRAAARAVADERLERMGLAELGARSTDRLSGGQAQRVALARALAADPELLLLDEPLAALDVETRGEVLDELRRHVAAFRGPVVLVTHSRRDLLAVADGAIVLEAGRVVQRGAVRDVLASPATAFVRSLADGAFS